MFVQQTGGPVNQALAGEADVMMISGVSPIETGGGVLPASVAIPAPSLTGQLQQPVQLGTITLPLWQWLLVAALLGGAGGYYLGRR
mgnify:CR=1 FL=1